MPRKHVPIDRLASYRYISSLKEIKLVSFRIIIFNFVFASDFPISQDNQENNPSSDKLIFPQSQTKSFTANLLISVDLYRG